MADVQLLAEQYCSKAYRVDFDYIWSRLQFVVPAQSGSGNTDSLSDRLATARAQVDFSILSLALSLTVPLVWLPYLAWTSDSPVKYLVIAAASPLLGSLFYWVALESRIAFGEVAMAAVDMYRVASRNAGIAFRRARYVGGLAKDRADPRPERDIQTSS
jgi:hypothetical protein